MTGRQFTHQMAAAPPTNTGGILQRRPLVVNMPGDRFEQEADRVADAVMRGRAAPFSLSAVPVARVQREDAPKEKTDEEKYKEAAGKLGEAFLATPLGKELVEKVKQDRLVKGATEAGKSFIGTLPGKIITGVAAAGAVTAFAATHKELPAQIPEIPLDALTPGLSVEISYKGPVDKPTEAMITFKFTEQAPKGSGDKKPALTESEKYRAETARIAADQARFRAGIKYPPGSPEDLQQKAEEAAIKSVAAKYAGGPDVDAIIKKYQGLGTPQLKSGLELTPPTPSFGYKPRSLLGDEYKLTLPGEKKKEDEPALQRKAAGDAAVDAAPPVVHETLAGPGQPLDAGTRNFMEGRFGYDFSQVRVHTDAQAAASARAVNAVAYTVGRDIVFAPGQYAPESSRGRHLVAHELAHVVQQNSGQFGSPLVQRLGVWESIGVFFGVVEGDFSDDELQAYLDKLEKTGQIEGDYDSDNKARAIVEQWKSEPSKYDLSPKIKKLMILEMLDGPTLIDDERRIMDLLENSSNRDLREIFAADGVDPGQLQNDLDNDETQTRLKAFFKQHFKGGLEGVMKGDMTLTTLDVASMTLEAQGVFINKYFPANGPMATKILQDILAVKKGEMDFEDEIELRDEIFKRMRVSQLMEKSQDLYGKSFEYPASPGIQSCPDYNAQNSLLNARVNKSARRYWKGPILDARLKGGHYFFQLTEEGRQNAYDALRSLFTPQSSICDRTLIHCDSLVTVIQFRAFAESIGENAFNARVKRGAIQMWLTYDGFTWLTQDGQAPSAAAVAMQVFSPSSEQDLVIGDHVVFWNHSAFDGLNAKQGSDWRLENAILIDKDEKGEDLYEGHGSSRRIPHRKMREDLIAAPGGYNQLVDQAEVIVKEIDSPDPATRQNAQRKLLDQFPFVTQQNGEWVVLEPDQQRPRRYYKLGRSPGPDDPDLIGLRNPYKPNEMWPVKRPVESRKEPLPAF